MFKKVLKRGDTSGQAEVDGVANLESHKFLGADVRADIQDRYQFSGDLLEIYAEGADELVHKWHHYLPIYDRYFAPWRDRPLRFLEIGVSKGGSLSMWRRYFGAEAVIFGIDIDENCRAYDGIAGQVRIGSQADTGFLNDVVAEMGGVDVVLDDGSHVMEHIKASLDALLPQVTDGGIYMIEDLHTAYWPSWGGGVRAQDNFFNQIRTMIDDMHHWYHQNGQQHPHLAAHFTSIHIHDSICVLEKQTPQRPTHSQVQRTAD
ncbi:class I SAM-dependent methyltransferase [uncultured Tateyamaria sp.]|uniref:class I SAM-dependent methyltransferase n=1 Tax=uncultured Tateyamaria sp. TaxID=455651 RepID=UPI0026046ED0|nr:class I SAM-dependent methyltransferase [uncultured Tateyamaria sp.]